MHPISAGINFSPGRIAGNLIVVDVRLTSYVRSYNLLGWPAFHQSTVHASPILYDIDKDGVREIALATYNGQILFFR